MNTKLIFITLVLLSSIIIGCSGDNGLITPSGPDTDISAASNLPVGVIDRFSDNSPLTGYGAMGLFNLHLNSVNKSVELIPLRQSSLTDVLEVVDITNFLQMAPCFDCVKIESISLDADGNLVVSIGIKHPFPAGDLLKPISGKNRGDLHVFNVEGTIVSNTTGASFPGCFSSSIHSPFR